MHYYSVPSMYYQQSGVYPPPHMHQAPLSRSNNQHTPHIQHFQHGGERTIGTPQNNFNIHIDSSKSQQIIFQFSDGNGASGCPPATSQVHHHPPPTVTGHAMPTNASRYAPHTHHMQHHGGGLPSATHHHMQGAGLQSPLYLPVHSKNYAYFKDSPKFHMSFTPNNNNTNQITSSNVAVVGPLNSNVNGGQQQQ